MKQKLNQGSEFQEIFTKLEVDLRATSKILILLFLIMAFLRFAMRTSIPLGLIILSIIWLCLYVFLWQPILKRQKNTKQLQNFYFLYNTLDIGLITGVVHYTGGAEWIGVIFYALTMTVAGLILPRTRAVLSAFIALFSYTLLISLEALGIIAHEPMFGGRAELYRAPNFLITQVLIAGAMFFFLVDTTGEHYEFLKGKQSQLNQEREKAVKAYQKAKESESVLEVRVGARTKELESVLRRQEEIISERTKELEEKVEDLEKFQKLVVGRELKMIELKESLEKAQKGKTDNKNNDSRAKA